MLKKTLLILISSTMLSCSEVEESRHFYDSHIYARFVERLDEEGVKYRRGENMSIFYPHSRSKVVSKIAKEVLAEYSPGCGGTIYDTDRRKALINELNERNIPYELKTTEEGEIITCPKEYREQFSKLLRSHL